ncbi:MAG: DUF429 domain-containing protein [Pseudomonadota bacterium]
MTTNADAGVSTDDLVLGLDGCPAGWIAVAWSLSSYTASRAAAPRSFLLRTLGDIQTLGFTPRVVAIDIPIGLPDHLDGAGRGCDVAARAVLGPRRSSVFAVPARAAVYAETYPEACAAAFAHSTPPRKVSKQCFFLFPKIREADAYLARHGKSALIECHPEVAFRALNGGEPLAEGKKIKGRINEAGMEVRRSLLENAGFPAAFLRELPYLRREVGMDDLLDACVCAWTAARIARGVADRFPADGGVDDRGVPMTIHA